MEVKDIYENLIEYQEILTEKYKYEEQIEELPKLIASKNEVLNRLKKAYLSKHNQYKMLEENIETYHKRINELQLQQKELEDKTRFVKSQREYEAIDKEVKNAQQRESEYNFQLMQDQRIKDDLKATIENYELNMKRQEEDIDKEQERIDGEISKIQKNLNTLTEEENKIINDLDDDLKYKFQKIVKYKEGIGIVSIAGTHCTGCNLTLPIDYINKVRSNEDIHFCPNCTRVLYYNEDSGNIFTLDEEANEDDDFFDLDI